MNEGMNRLQTSKIFGKLSVITDKWHDVDDQTMGKAILQWKRGMEGLYCTFSANQLIDDFCDVLVWPDAYERLHE